MEGTRNKHLKNVKLGGLAILKPAKSAQNISVWMAQYILYGIKVTKLVCVCTSLGHLDSVVLSHGHPHVHLYHVYMYACMV